MIDLLLEMSILTQAKIKQGRAGTKFFIAPLWSSLYNAVVESHSLGRWLSYFSSFFLFYFLSILVWKSCPIICLRQRRVNPIFVKLLPFTAKKEIYYFLYVFFFLEYESSTTVLSTTVSGGKWSTRFDLVTTILLRPSWSSLYNALVVSRS